jgi:hypothetical protein
VAESRTCPPVQLGTHCPPQISWPAGHSSHRQVVALNTCPEAQLLETHWPPHSTVPAGHTMFSHWQVVAFKVCPEGQFWTQVLLPGQSVVPVWHSHWQVVAFRTCPPVQLDIHCPLHSSWLLGHSHRQVVGLKTSPEVAEHPCTQRFVPAHNSWPLGQAHCPPTQLAPCAQVLPHRPQLATSVVRSRHTPPQSLCPCGQAHAAPWQVLPPLQALPHVPQLVTVFKGVHVPLQHASPDEQPQIVPHTCAFWQQVVPRLVVPAGHAHLPCEHEAPCGQQFFPHWTPLGHVGFLAQAVPGTEANTPPKRTPPSILSALRRLSLPSARILASSSKELPVVLQSVHSP